MKSKWLHLKPEAIQLRKAGKSLTYVHNQLNIPKSTLSNWFKDITLTDQQLSVLDANWKKGLEKARLGAAKWHNQQKKLRLQLAKKEALRTITSATTDVHTTEIALAMLYLGEGTKKKTETGMGSSDPEILIFFLKCLRTIYNVPEEKIRCELHLRADQDPEKMISYWSKTLGVSSKYFTKPFLDQRTAGTKTYPDYKGVCLVRCGQVAIQRKLVYIARYFCKEYGDARLAQG